ncbi:hypothetical protein ACJRO7_033488 [Eucalyptus globulus]|uniref:non-specific serine/threonine protein kinase n=1 Tax=Eucalyptus globulus TaxID=34317 RepID=A0ABD3JZI3_EUCGL
MAARIFCLLPLAFLFIIANSQGQENISLTDTLTPTSKSSWLSPSGVFAFGFYQIDNSYYVGIFLPRTPNKTVVWTYDRDSPPLPSNSTLHFDGNGGLVLQSAKARDKHVASPTDTIFSASMLDLGNFVLYNSNQEVIWQSFDTPTDTILGGQRLPEKRELQRELHSSASVTNPSTGLFLAIMQLDGVLALYPNGKPFTPECGYWDSMTPNNGQDVTLHLENDGFLYLLKPPGIYLANFTNQGIPKEDMIYLARIDPDGIFRLYSYDITRNDDLFVKWQEPIDRRSPMGRCGLNGSEQKHTRRDILIAVGSLIAFVIVMLAVFGIIVYRNRVWESERPPREGFFLPTIEDVAPTSYTFENLKKVTGNFSEEIGRRTFGTVYKGTLMKNQHSSKAVAVKKLKESEGEREFLAKVKTIGKTHHRNLVRLLGYCHDGENRLLVYEYMSNGSLADVLFKAKHQVSWDVKMGIAQNVARGLLYLHEECKTQIVHCDIKPQNILIDDNMQAKIADFGLSKLLKPNQTNTTTMIRGTRGYVAPEYFGVVLLEIICGRRFVDSNLPKEEAILEDWVYHCFQAGELDKLVHYQTTDQKQLERMVKVALWCIQEEPALCPSMRKVLLMLEGTVGVPIPPCLTSFPSVI